MSRNWLLVVAGIAVAVSAVSAYLARPVVDGLTTAEPVRRLGRLPQGTVVPVEFELVNQSPQPIDLLRVASGCSCAVGDLSKKSLAPAERCPLEVKWRTGTRRGPFGSDLAVIFTQGGQEYALKLRLEADVEPDFLYAPETLTFRAGRKSTESVTLSRGRVPDTTIRNAFANHRAFQVRLMPDRSQVEVTFDPEQWPAEGAVVELTIETSSTNEPSFKVPLAVD